MPIYQEAPYTHFPPLPHWLFGGVYLLFGKSEAAARFLALVFSFAGIFFALRSLSLLVSLLMPQKSGWEASPVFYAAAALLTLHPGFLFFADGIQQMSLTYALVWASLYWCLSYLFGKARLGWGIFLYFLHVWISFEWLVPLLLILLFCIYKKEGGWRAAVRPAILFLLLGVMVPVGLRLAQNAWALGGVREALMDLALRAKARSVGDPTEAEMTYHFFKHAAKFGFGLLWFVGIPALLMLAATFRKTFGLLKENKTAAQFLLLWGLGSLSWQFLMPQNAMIHAYTQIEFANFLFFGTALGAILFWEEKAKILFPLLILFGIGAGAKIKSEIFQPFLRETSQQWAAQTCEADRRQMLAEWERRKGGLVDTVRENFAALPPAASCDEGSRRAVQLLKLTSFGVKSRL